MATTRESPSITSPDLRRQRSRCPTSSLRHDRKNSLQKTPRQRTRRFSPVTPLLLARPRKRTPRQEQNPPINKPMKQTASRKHRYTASTAIWIHARRGYFDDQFHRSRLSSLSGLLS